MSAHGTNTRYKAGCSCQPCRAAHNAYMARITAGARARAAADPALIPHGTRCGYLYWGCTCGDCRAANAAYHRQYYAALRDRANEAAP